MDRSDPHSGRESDGLADATAARPDEAALFEALTLEEKVSLLAGKNVWITTPVPRLGIPAIKVTDGPNGARGDGASGARAVSFPVGSALASSWNTALIHAVGEALGLEARSKNAQVLLGPAVNLHRTPLGGRNFECYSEDPYLSGRIATAFIQGVQTQGVGACIKHFVCNDSEYQRHSMSSDVDQRTLREIYLLPFEMAIRDARPWAVMSAYNRVNGTYASSHGELLRDILKGEWEFDGVVMSDWGAALETEANLNGGLDLEMPGPARSRGQALLAAVREGRVAHSEIDDAARRMLRLIIRSGRFENPQVEPERSEDRPEHRSLVRRAAAEGMVLLRNDGMLPLRTAAVRRLAVIGPNAAAGQIQGGGSSAVFPHYQVMPLDGLRACADWQVSHAPGCFNHKYLPMPAPGMLSFDGKPGARLRLFEPGGQEPVLERMVELGFDPLGGLPLHLLAGRRLGSDFDAVLEADFTPEASGEYQFGLLSAGLSRLYLDGQLLIDNWTSQEPGDAFMSAGSTERRASVRMSGGAVQRWRIEFRSTPGLMMNGVRYGILPPHPENLMNQAVDLARDADAVVLVVGSNADWETEGNDRTDMALPGAQETLIEAVLDANPHTVVVLNTGAPVAMPWFDRAGAVLQAWLPGQEFGHALADVLTGAVNPAGRMPCTIPKRLEDTPAYTSYPGEHGHVLYGERVFVGYRWYDSRDIDPRVPFGHGLSYGQFDYDDLTLAETAEGVEVGVTIANVGKVAGQEVVQLYLAPRTRDSQTPQRPAQALRGFVKVDLQPGERQTVSFPLTSRDFAVWDPERGAWVAEAGRFEIRIGASSRDIRLRAEWELRSPFRAA